MDMQSHALVLVLSFFLVAPLLFLLLQLICRTDGSWISFGDNQYGQLGLGDETDRSTPTAVTALGTNLVESCALGASHTICKK
jgi:alpha-tubulin suppressor-like RCC1 family protein